MGLVEIILTILVWRKGWRWLSIIPAGTAFVLALIIGLFNANLSNVYFLDILAIIALIVMYFKKSKKFETKEE